MKTKLILLKLPRGEFVGVNPDRIECVRKCEAGTPLHPESTIEFASQPAGTSLQNVSGTVKDVVAKLNGESG